MGPLAGLKIVEFDGLGPVPLCAMILADLGAEVVRVARPPSGAVAFDDVGGVVLHRGRPMVELDLKSADDLKQVRALISSADALIEGFRPGVMERLGLGPDVCLGLKPALVYGRMTGWGQTGPLAPRAGHDINYVALSGALHGIGDPDRPPPPPLNLIGDYGAGAMMLAVGVLAALRNAAASGQGQVVDAAMTDGAAVLMSLFYAFRATGAWNDARSANMLDGGAPYYRCYACADGRFVAVGALEPAFFARLIAGLGMAPDAFVQNDQAGWPAMRERFTVAFATEPRDHWTGVFEGVDACVTPVLDMGEAPLHAHNAARSAFFEHDGALQPSPAPRFSRTPAEVRPTTAAKTVEAVLASWARI